MHIYWVAVICRLQRTNYVNQCLIMYILIICTTNKHKYKHSHARYWMNVNQEIRNSFRFHSWTKSSSNRFRGTASTIGILAPWLRKINAVHQCISHWYTPNDMLQLFSSVQFSPVRQTAHNSTLSISVTC